MEEEAGVSAGPEGFIACAVQLDPKLGRKADNLDAIEHWIREAAGESARLLVFPECSVTGYEYASREETLEVAEPIPGPTTDRLSGLARELDCYVAVGLVEHAGESLHNAAVLVGPTGLIATYHKSHLPLEAVDRFVDAGGELGLTETSLGRIGMLICYDLRFPEPARVLTLGGADIIVDLTNLPEAGAPQPEFMYQTRAAENRVWLVAANRVGEERGVRFIGRSAIVDPAGVKVAEAKEYGEEAIYAEIRPALARDKDLVIAPGEHELHLMTDRRPELYGSVSKLGS
jgi:predicted amidohydrolase